LFLGLFLKCPAIETVLPALHHSRNGSKKKMMLIITVNQRPD